MKTLSGLPFIFSVAVILSTAFTSVSKESSNFLFYQVYGVQPDGILASHLQHEIVGDEAENWVDSYQPFLENLSLGGFNPVDLDVFRTTYCDETVDTYICLIEIARDEMYSPVLVAKYSNLGVVADFIFGEYLGLPE